MPTKKIAVVIWLILGLVMLYFQIIIGGITRLTGSGLSITKWEIVTGTFPPSSEAQWIVEFDKYKETPQFKKINDDMELGSSVFDNGSFKFIYFWEYFHRLWARSMGFVFIFPFLFFLWKKMLPKFLVKDLGIVVALAGLAATFGWIMVASGLNDRPWVNAYKLSIHLSIGISVFSYLLWAFIKYFYERRVFKKSNVINTRATKAFFILLIVQIVFGGIMSGMKASMIFPTWPDIGGEYLPAVLIDGSMWNLDNFIDYDKGAFTFSLMHFIHRSLAYLIVLVAAIYWFRQVKNETEPIIKKVYLVFIFLLVCQVILGILTVINSVGYIPVLWGVLHQGVAVLLFGTFIIHYFFVLKVRNAV